MSKKIIAALLALTCVFTALPLAFAENETAPKLYTFYGDGMLFKQNETAVVSGTAKNGSVISVTLFNSNDEFISDGTVTVTDGTFAVSFEAPSGSYEQYKLVLKADGKEFATLKDVVFGEQWLASGQSNMQYTLAQDKSGAVMFANGQKLDEWLRVLLVPDIPEYKGSKELVPVDPQVDIPGAQWVTGENSNVYSMSAVAYYFAVEMRKELNMPIGIINVPLGGTSISTWLSREAIDSDPQVKNDLMSSGKYIEKSDWKEDKVNVYSEMTTNYNLKIEAIKNFKLSGMIWYQGESEIQRGHDDDRYFRSFDLMQRSYTELFGYEDGLLPIVYTQLASFYYSDEGYELMEMNIRFTDMQKLRPESRAVITISDVPLTFLPSVGAIHPECKQTVGERMAFAAKGLVYDKYSNYTAASLKNAECRNGSVYVTLENVGDGIAMSGDRLSCFAVCGSDGVYVQANAEIIGKDTVRIWSDSVPEPCSATYAYCVCNQRANLYSTHNGELLMPVGTFVTDSSYNTHFWKDRAWADCDSDTVWRCENSNDYTTFHDTWSAKKAEISFDAQNAFDGDSGMNIKAESKKFSVSPVTTYKKNSITTSFRDSDKNYSDYGKVSFYVRNNGNSDVIIDSLRFCRSSLLWYAPAVDDTGDPQFIIPADGQWHLVTFDLNSVYLFGNECGFTYSNNRLKKINSIKLYFSCDGEADVSVDEFRFEPSYVESGIRFEASFAKADNLIELFSTVLTTVIGFVVGIFD